MKRIALLFLASACAHAPGVEVAKTDVAFAADSVTIIREAVRSELLAASRPNGQFDLALRVYGEPNYLGTIDYTGTSKTNHEATTPFSNTGDALCGKVLLLQPSTAVYIGRGVANNSTVTAANGVKVAVDERVIWMPPQGTSCFIAALRVSSDGNLKVWELK